MRVKPFLTQEALLTLFHSLILSHIRYCITTWCYGRSVLLNKLQKLCNKFINMIICTNPAKKRNKEMIKDNIFNIQQLFKLNISIFMYKSFRKQLPSAFNNIFQRKTSTVITRSNSQIIPISCKNTLTKQSIRYIGPKIWNELPEKIKLCKSLSTFVKKSKAFFLEQQSNLLLFFFYLYIYPPDSQESDGDAIHRVSNYPDLLPEMPRYCCPLVIW